MQIRILTAVGGYRCGMVVDVPAEQAGTWIGVGDAELVAASAAVETARVVAPAVETAMKPKARGR